MRVGIVGCGLIGRRRAQVIRQSESDVLTVVADVDAARAQALGAECGCSATTDWQSLVARADIDAVIVSTVNQFLMPITLSALAHGKHVLCEKPLGRNAAEAMQMVQAARQHRRLLKTGFNHRHHPALCKAHALSVRGAVGVPMFIRCIYGHGGRPGYEKEWRANAELAGGGELLDQGVHVIDLCRWFLGDFAEAIGYTATSYWNLGYFPDADQGQSGNARRQLEDNAFGLLRTAGGQTAILHSSWTQWRNRFCFELFGRDGYLIVEGLGGSYGLERLTLGRRRPESGPPEEDSFEFPGPDLSWEAEWSEFRSAVDEGRQPLGNGEDGLQAMRAIDALYRSARTGALVKLP